MGKPGVRLTDMTAHGGTIMGPGVPTVMTGKMPAATILDQHVCPMVTGVVPHVGGPATLASTGVFIGKKPAGRVGDLHVCVGPPSMPVMGCFTVLIGEVGSAGGGASAGSAASAASAKTKSPASVDPFPLSEPPQSTEIHYSHFQFTDSAGKGLGGIPYTYTGPDHAERRGSSAPGGEVYYSGLPKGGSYKVKAGAVSDAKWSKAKAALDEELEMTAKADGLKDGTDAILTVLERSNTGRQRFLHHADCKVSGNKIKAKWKVDLGPDDAQAPPADKSQRESFVYQFIAYAAGGVSVSDKLEIHADLEIEVLDEIEQPVADKPVEVLLTNGEVKTGKLDAKGKFKVGNVPAKPASVRLKVPGVFRGTLPGGFFDPGKCFIISASTDFLPFQEVVKFSNEHPDFNLLIVGHTDRVGDEKSNLALSKARAESLEAFLKDDVAKWEAWYDKSKAAKVRWGVLEDKHMLKALQDGGFPFLAGAANNKADQEYIAAIKHFQSWSNGKGTKLPVTGAIDSATRKELIKNYMASDGVSLPASVSVTTHGCGESHNIHPTADGVPDFTNRRVELYFFEGDITPPPVANCPSGGCAEWSKWHSGTTNLLKITPTAVRGIQRNEFSQAMLDCFKDIDTNKDGVLDEKELLTAVGNKSFKGEHGAMLACIYSMISDETKEFYKLFSETSDDEAGKPDSGFSLLDIDAYDRLRATNPNDKLVKRIDNDYFYSKQKIIDPLRTIFVGPLLPHAMSQGLIGDCWFLVAMVALADLRPNEISAMIKSKGAGEFEVKFPGVNKAVTILAPTDAEIGLFSSTTGNGIWPTILEKAYGYIAAKYLKSNKTGPADGADGGDDIKFGIEILTGSPVQSIEFTWPTFDFMIRRRIKTAVAAKKIVTAAIYAQEKDGKKVEYTADGLARRHAYSIIGYDTINDSVMVRNPWGHATYKGKSWPAGIFQAKLEDFISNFNSICIEE